MASAHKSKQRHKFVPQSAVVVIHDQLGAVVHGVPLSMTDSDNGARDESRQCTSHISMKTVMTKLPPGMSLARIVAVYICCSAYFRIPVVAG